MLKRLLLFIFIIVTGSLSAQTMYWVGGSGHWNDIHHWSYTSGGPVASKSPDLSNNVVFDDNSSLNTFVVNFTGLSYASSVEFLNQTKELHFTGSNLSSLTCAGKFILNDKTYFDANTSLIFSNATNQYSIVNFWKNTPNSNVTFVQGNWDLQSVQVSDKSLLKFIKGNYRVLNASLVAGDLEANVDSVNFNSSHGIFYVKNAITLGSKVTFNSTDLVLIAQKNNPALYSVNSAVKFGVNPKVLGINPSPQACSITYTFASPSCAGSCDGSITIGFDPSCNAGPFNLLFNNGSGCFPSGVNSVSPPVYVLNNICSCAGQLAVYVFDANDGSFVTQLTKLSTPQEPTPINLLFSGQKRPTCFGDCDGSVNIFPTGGLPPYNIVVKQSPSGTTVGTYSNIPSVTTTTVPGLCGGTFSFVVTDANNCTKSFVTTINQPTAVSPNVTPTNVSCNLACNGSAVSSASGGTPPYTYSWTSASSTPSTAAISSIGSLCPGVVTMTVTDSNTCSATFSATITQPPAITLMVTKVDLNCGNICNGTASVTATGGIGAFSYSWSPSGGTASQAIGLCAGIYTCTVTNNVNCIKTITVSVFAPPTLTATPTQTNIVCHNLCTGTINLHPSGGTGAYTYTWSPVGPTTPVITNLCAGAYSYTIGDAVGCVSSNTLTITQPPATTLSVVSTSTSCNGACDGTATANLNGGTTPYSYTWQPVSPPITGQGSPSISALCPATYTLLTNDANSCPNTQTFTVTQPTIIAANVTSVSPTCNGSCNGSISSAPTGGTGPYTFTLQSLGVTIVANPPYSNLCAGTYTLFIKDAKGCIKPQVINLSQPNAITLVLNSTSINCFNLCNASISAVVNGGSPLYTFSWSASTATTSALTNQCAGVKSATVTDVNGCTATASVTVISRPEMTISIVPTNPSCNSQCTGVATTSVSGGTPNYTISLSNGSIGNIISGLCQGTYTATVKDFFGCVKTQVVSIVTPPAITLTTTNGTVSCAGSCDGTVSVTPSGGTSGYSYSWNSTPVQTNAIANNLCVGNYITTITDALGCVASATASVVQPPALSASINNVKPSCNVCIGAATASGIGGTAPYTYSWLPGGQTIPSPADLCVGIQTVIVTDSKGCSSTQTVQINQTVITLITTNGNTLTCNGGCSGIATANPSGGAGAFSYTWTSTPIAPIQNTQTATGLCAGTHTVTVADINGCWSTNVVSFTNPPAITLTVNQTNVSCNSACDGIATASATGGTGLITYVWQPGGLMTSSIGGLCAGNYTVTATDGNSCSQSQIVTITEAAPLAASFTFTTPTTCTALNGIINATITGGVSPYTFTWSPSGSTVNPLINLGAGTYSLNIQDFTGCTQTIVATLSNPTGPTVTATTNSIACFGTCTGTATLSILGTGPFSVNGTGVVGNIATLSGLCAGNNTPVIGDGNGCVTNQTLMITAPAQLTANGTVTNDRCNAVCSASINLTPIGGTLPYSYAWTPSGGSVQDPINLCAGNYTVNITDLNNCVITNTYVVTQPNLLTLNFNKKDVLCNGQCTGGVKAIVGGGTAPYSYTWTASVSFATANLDTIVNLCSGIYTVNVKDANGCVISGTITIGEPTPLTSTISSVNAKCNGQCNATAVINASGGVGPYTYHYNTTPVTPTQTIGGLCVGTYTGIVADANGCASSNNFVITEPLPIIITTLVSNPKCNAVCNGSVATSVTGGNPNYNYTWIATGGPVQNPTGLCAGNYTVIVTDDSLCTSQAVIVLTDPVILLANTSFTNPTCNTVCNGIVSANPIGGTTPFSYSWQTPAVNTNSIVSNLCAGNYTLTLTDANLCQDIQVVTLTNPTPITVNPALSPATCGLNNGSINAIGGSGIAPYTYNWLPPISAAQTTNPMVTGLGAGVYTVIVTDASGCSATIAIPLSNSNGPSGATITSTNVTCNTLCNGAASISNPVGGTSPYTVSWLSPVSASALITNLCAGVYTAQISDANNCLFFQAIAITEPQVIDDNEIFTSASCFGNCNGAIALNPTGGNGGYTYSWSTLAATGTISGLCPGVYTATVTDAMGCVLVGNYNLPSLVAITSSTFVTNNNCFGSCTGSILSTNVAGGLPPYSFVWTDPAGQSTAAATNLCNGNYSVTITDANGCFNVIPANISSPAQITFTPTVIQPNCGLCNGVANINTLGGIPPYNYLWSNSQTGNSTSNLCAGVYGLQIKDGNGCLTTTNVIINNSSTITGENVTFANVSCVGTPCDGTVTVTAVGGVAPIAYHWLHDNSSIQTLTGLCAGTYYCNMTDANGCTKTASVVIGSTTTLTLSPQITQSSCSANTGSITVNVAGGSGTYTYAWLPAGSTSTLTNLAPGNYTLTVSDGACSQTQVYAINSINGPIVVANQNNITCAGLCNGSISLGISGGNPLYATSWSTGATTQTLTNLCAGLYSYTVTDVAGCKAVQSFTLTTNSPVVFSAPTINNPLCNGNCNGVINTIPSGGALPYIYSWASSSSTTSIANNLCAGNYSVLVNDANGCAAQQTYTLVSPASISVTAVLTDAKCTGSSNGAIDITVTGGTPGSGYTFTWTPTGSVFTEDLTNLSAGTYSVIITDANNCSIDSSFVINEPTVVVANEVIVPSACFGNCNGSITLSPSGGTAPYTYTWSPSTSNTNTATNLCPSTQTVTVGDSQGCNVAFTYTVPTLTTVTSTTLSTNNICFNDCNGILTVTNTVGGVAPYAIQWNDPLLQYGNTAIGLCTGSYTAIITDANGCYSEFPASISSNSQVTFTPTITQPSCDLCNGSVTVNPTGGVAPYTYLWSNNDVVNTATNLCGGVYAVQVTDASGCVNVANAVINSASGIMGEIVAKVDVTCDAAACDGTANVTAVGGVAPISYNWTYNNSTSQTVSGLCAGTYYCNMTDANGCSRTASVVINAVTTLTISSQVSQSSCTSSTGSITVSALGGTGVYTYAWLPSGNTPTLTNLAPGTYTLNVSDGNCTKSQIFTIQSINAPVVSSVTKDISCNGICDGAIALTILGGTPMYNVLWSNGATTTSVSSLCAGNYSVEVTDAAGCKAVRNFSLSTIAPIVFSTPSVAAPKCHDGCNGSLTAIPVGGTMPYTFTWTPSNVNTATTNSLCAGNYTVVVADASGCAVSNNYAVLNPPILALTATIIDASCNTALDGSIDVTVIGGSPSYSYSWTPGNVTTEDLTNLLSSTYSLTITDSFGCMIDSMFVVNSTITVNALAGNNSTFCQNGLLLLDGSNSNGGITYQWTEFPSGTVISNTLISNVTPATGTSTYVLTATNGLCIDSDTIIVNSNPLPIVDAGPTISIPVFSSATIGGSPTTASGNTIVWTPALGLSNPVDYNPTTTTTITTIYTVSVVDANGCANFDTVTVYVYPEIKIPNGFSPNGDGKNDVWQIDLISQFPECEVEVYNRWGEQLFYSRGYSVPFNGQYKGQNLPVGTYYYVIKLNHPNYPDPYTSPLTIFR